MLVDAASLYFRAFFGVPESVTAPDGMPINAVRGYLDMTATLLQRRRPSRYVACLDLDWRPAFRVIREAFAPGAPRPGRGGAGGGTAHRLGRARRRAARLPGRFLGGADIELDGDAELQQAVRFALFHTLQAGARAERRAIAAKGLTGPATTATRSGTPRASSCPCYVHGAARGRRRAALAARDARLARERAEQLGLEGAAFPWRTIRGQECSGYWPAGTAAFHISADIADAVVRYQAATGDEEFEREVGLELLVETARLWRSLGHHDPRVASGSTASPAPTSTARSPTTTSTRT